MPDMEDLRVTDAQAWVEAMDTRERVPCDKDVDLSVLDAATGGYGLCDDAGAVVIVEGSPLTADELAAAIKAYVPVLPEPIPEPFTDDEVRALRKLLGSA